MKHYTPNGRSNHGRPLKRLLDTWDRNGSTSGPTPWQIYDDDNVRCSFVHCSSVRCLSVVYLSVVRLPVVRLSVVRLSVVRLSVVRLSVLLSSCVRAAPTGRIYVKFGITTILWTSF
jgi:hypothetical protein